MTEISRPWLTTWGEVLEALPSLRRSDMVSFGDGPMSTQAPCLVSDSRDLEEDDDLPPEAQERGWRHALLKEQVEGVVNNLSQQVDGGPDPELVMRGVAFYMDNDAFLEVS